MKKISFLMFRCAIAYTFPNIQPINFLTEYLLETETKSGWSYIKLLMIGISWITYISTGDDKLLLLCLLEMFIEELWNNEIPEVEQDVNKHE